MHDIVDTLGPAATAGVLGVPLDTAPFEMLNLRDGISVALQQYRSPEDLTARIVGEDLFKLHVQLSGQRLLNFERRHEIDICGASTAVLMHDAGVAKIERLVANPFAQSITVYIGRNRVWQYLEEEKTVVSPALRSFIIRKRTQPRLAVAAPAPEELAVAAAVINSRRTGPVRRLFAEAKAMELFCLILDRFQSEAPLPGAGSSIKITERDRRQLSAVRDTLNGQFLDPPSIHALARQFGLNRNKLCGGFQTLYGASIYDFCRNLRLEKARRMLAESDLSIVQIAEAAGFASASAFSASFARQFGRAPSRSRRL
jgi:AraC family transcriptional activator of pyochelin receptor